MMAMTLAKIGRSMKNFDMPIDSYVMKYPAASCGVSEERAENYPKAVPFRDVFIVGSTMLTTTLSHIEWVGGPVPISPGFPLKHAGMTVSGKEIILTRN